MILWLVNKQEIFPNNFWEKQISSKSYRVRKTGKELLKYSQITTGHLFPQMKVNLTSHCSSLTDTAYVRCRVRYIPRCVSRPGCSSDTRPDKVLLTAGSTSPPPRGLVPPRPLPSPTGPAILTRHDSDLPFHTKHAHPGCLWAFLKAEKKQYIAPAQSYIGPGIAYYL